MKYKRVLGIFLIVSILVSLCLFTLPASPALAVGAITLSPSSGKIGDTVIVSGSLFPIPDTTTSYLAFLYFSNQQKSMGQLVGTDVTVYKTIGTQQISATGTINVTFTVPDALSSNTPVVPGTYYIYVTVMSSTSSSGAATIQTSATFTVTGGDVTLSPVEGIVGTSVSIAGDGYTPSTAIALSWDSVALAIASGQSTTDASGNFQSTFLAPPSTAGQHTLTVTVGTYSSTKTFTVKPSISINPQTGEPGASVSISGTGFSRNPQVIIKFLPPTGMGEVLEGNASAYTRDVNGNFSWVVTIPTGFTPGSYTIEASEGANYADATFALTAATITTTTTTSSTTTTTTTTTTEPPTSTTTTAPGSISPPGDTYAVGAGVYISGTGLLPDADVVIEFDGEPITASKTTAQGLLIAPVIIPVTTGGIHLITATDGLNVLEVPITIESVPPTLPTISSPGAGSRVKAPVTFTWSPVTDPSAPVTYELQIATAGTFAEGTVIISKPLLTTATYELTETEQAIISARDITYYWRVRATDAASNSGAWTAGANFAIAPPFKFTGWPLYLTMGIGAVLVFCIGYLLGRRTAFRF